MLIRRRLEMGTRRKRSIYGAGSVYQRSDGQWVAVALVPGQAPKRLYASSEESAQERRNNYLAERRLGIPAYESKLSLARHLEIWLEGKRPPTVRPSTYVSYDLHVRHLNRSIGSIALVKLTPNDVRRHSRRLLDEHLSPRSVALNLTVLRMALRQAVDDGLIPRNVAAQVDKPRSVRPDLDILRPLEVKRFMAAARRDKNGALWMVLIGTGIRLGEALGLRWPDLDLTDRTMRVSGSVRQVRKLVRTPGERRLQRVEPKTESGWRTLALAPTVAAALTKRKAEVAAQPRNVESYVFTSSNGTLLDPRNVDRLFHDFLDKAGLRRIRIHDLRHSAASIMLTSGATLDDVKRYLGHSSISVTSDIYGHLVEGRSAEVAGGIERAIRAKR
jgi:integrase